MEKKNFTFRLSAKAVDIVRKGAIKSGRSLNSLVEQVFLSLNKKKVK